jgi:hypothetical protein
MGRLITRQHPILIFTLIFILFLSACKSVSTSPSTIPTTSAAFTQPQLEYLLLDKYPDVFWCDPDYYPVAKTGQEQQNAIDQFSAIMSNQVEFSAILQRLNLPVKTDYTDAEKLLIYQEYKKLTYAAQLTAEDNGYHFELAVGAGQGQRIIGTITNSGTITETSRASSVNSCPICLVKGTLIDTPSGPVCVEDLTVGMTVWTVNAEGTRVATAIIATTSTPVPLFFRAVRVELSDGRSVTASPGHPTAEGKAINDYQVGDRLNGGLVTKKDYIIYDSAATYDILPAGDTGFYWADGILLGSTLKGN